MSEDNPCGETGTAVEVIARLENELTHVEELFNASCKDYDALRDKCQELVEKWRQANKDAPIPLEEIFITCADELEKVLMDCDNCYMGGSHPVGDIKCWDCKGDE